MPDWDRISLRQIKYFLAVADHGSFRRAAERLGVTQPTLTSQIATLEHTLETQLLERSRRGTTVSSAGRDLLPGARRILEEVQGFSERASALSAGVEGTYRLGVTPTLGPYLLPRILPTIHASHAGLKLYVREAPPRELEDELKRANHDVILTTEPVHSSGLVVSPLFREPLVLAMAKDHRLADKARVNRSDLIGEKVLTIGENHLLHRQIIDLCERLGAELLRDYEGTSLDTLRQMVVMGMGIAFLPALYVESEIRDRADLVIADIEGLRSYRNHALVWRPTSPARSFFGDLSEQIRGIIDASTSPGLLVARR
ncbi:MAG: hydrogen peroxide-inducible genes activator [Pseudomonadota bacterium]